MSSILWHSTCLECFIEDRLHRKVDRSSAIPSQMRKFYNNTIYSKKKLDHPYMLC